MKVKNNTVILSPERETAGRAPGSKGLRTSLKAFPWLLMGLLICFGVMVSLSACKKDDSVQDAVSSAEEAVEQGPHAIQLYGNEYMSDASTIDLTAASIASTDELLAHISEFTNLESVDVTGCSVSNEDLWKAQQQMGDVDLVWNVKICDKEVPTSTRFMFVSVTMQNSSIVKGIRISNNNTDYEFPFGILGEKTTFPNDGGIENIQYVDGLEGLRISSDSYDFDIAWIQNLPKLKSMTLEGRIVNPGLLTQMPQIEELAMGCSLQDQYPILGELKKLKKLEVYNTYDCLPFSILKDLTDLQSLNVEVYSGDEYNELIEILKTKTSFEKLQMTINTSDKIDFSLLNETSTTQLGIAMWRIGSGSTDSLSSLQKLNSLAIYTYKKIVSQSDADKLKESLPGCEITYWPWN